MTCIVGVVEGGTVWIGGDSAGVDAWHQLDLMAQPKVFRKGPMLIGYTSSFRMGQLLEHVLAVPLHHPETSVEKYLASEFLDAVRKCYQEHGFIKKTAEREEGGTFLVGYRGRLFQVQDDHAVLETSSGYAACGSGWMLALGSLHATSGQGAEARVHKALEAAEAHVSSVRGPFKVEVLRP